jgi:hypothetical protein
MKSYMTRTKKFHFLIIVGSLDAEVAPLNSHTSHAKIEYLMQGVSYSRYLHSISTYYVTLTIFESELW